MFTYTVQKVLPSQLTVLYPDNSVAEVPVYEGESKEVIEQRIAQFYHPPTEGFATADEVPFTAGEIGEAEEVSHAQQLEVDNGFDPSAEVLNYQLMREMSYPSINQQLIAMHAARQGDTTLLDAVDAQMAAVNEMFSEAMPDMTREEFENLVTRSSEL